MHICFVTHEYPKKGFPHGGVGIFIQLLARSLVKRGITVSVVGINYTAQSEAYLEEGVFIYRLGIRKIKGFTWLLNSNAINKKLRNINQKNKIDIVECTELGLAFINKKKGIQYIIRLHGGHHFFAESEQRKIHPWKGFQEKRSFAKADKILGVSDYVFSHTAKYIEFADRRGPVVYNPADFSKLYAARPEKMIEGRIFFVGTICEKKGIRQLIQAMPIIKKECANAHLVIAGRDSKIDGGASYKSYVSQFITNDVKNAITFLGPVSNEKIPELIEEAEVCVYPSHMEAMPIAWIEVMSMGKAFIGSNTGPGPELINNGKTGLICDPMDPLDIAKKTISVLKDKALGKLLGKNARIEMLSRFEMEKIVQQNIDFYKGII